MESLALAAAIVVLAIIAFGVVSLITAIRPPTRRWLRILVSIPAIAALVAGVWLASIEIGIGGRLIGVVVAALGLAALARTWR